MSLGPPQFLGRLLPRAILRGGFPIQPAQSQGAVPLRLRARKEWLYPSELSRGRSSPVLQLQHPLGRPPSYFLAFRGGLPICLPLPIPPAKLRSNRGEVSTWCLLPKVRPPGTPSYLSIVAGPHLTDSRLDAANQLSLIQAPRTADVPSWQIASPLSRRRRHRHHHPLHGKGHFSIEWAPLAVDCLFRAPWSCHSHCAALHEAALWSLWSTRQ